MKRRLKKKMKKNCASWEKKRGKRLTEKIHSSIREQNPGKKNIHIGKWNCTVYRIFYERSFDWNIQDSSIYLFDDIGKGNTSVSTNGGISKENTSVQNLVSYIFLTYLWYA